MITATATLTGTITATAQIRSVQTGSCAAATVTNQAEDYSLSIASGATEKLPFGKVKNKEGNDVQVDYKPAADGYIFQETACPSSSSVSLAASDTTPDFGDTVTLTATTSGFTGSIDYTFSVVNNLGNYVNTTQTDDNTFDWVVPYYNEDTSGVVQVHVMVMDGSGNMAWTCIEITVTDLYDKHGIEHAWRAVDSVLVSNEVDEIPDHVGTSDATAPSSTTRLKYVKDPTNSANGVVRSTRLDRLGTNISTLQSAITIAGVFYNGQEEETTIYNEMALVGGNAGSGIGSRYGVLGNHVLSTLSFVVRSTSGNVAFVVISGVPSGKNVWVMHFDGSELRVIHNGTEYTNTASGTIYGTSSTFNLFNTNGVYSNQAGWIFPTSEIMMRLSDIGNAGADQLYQDLLLKYPA